MGFVKKVFSKPKPKPVQQVAQPANTQKSASQIAEEDAKRKKQAAIVANAGANKAATVGGGENQVTKKVLLGL